MCTSWGTEVKVLVPGLNLKAMDWISLLKELVLMLIAIVSLYYALRERMLNNENEIKSLKNEFLTLKSHQDKLGESIDKLSHSITKLDKSLTKLETINEIRG